MNTYWIAADKFFLPGAVVCGGFLPIRDGKFGIWQPAPPIANLFETAEILDLSGTWVTPGMVDTHIHGFCGHATTDADATSMREASIALARYGTTSWLPTPYTDDVERIGKQCAAIAQAIETRAPNELSARIQGIYLEGPFFTLKHIGAQNPAYVIDPSYEIYARWQERAKGHIVKCSLAPERAGSLEFVARVTQEGITCAIGHTDATFEEALAAVNAGATLFVHTYNGQRGLHHREPGTLGCAMTTPSTYAELICDGRHVAPAALKALIDAKGWQHIALITDCLPCGGMPDGQYMSGGLAVELRDGLCYLRNTGTIAGSVLTLAQGVKNIVDWNIATAEQAIRMATEIPALSAGIENVCGSIKPGRDADFCVFKPDMTLAATYVGGMQVPQHTG